MQSIVGNSNEVHIRVLKARRRQLHNFCHMRVHLFGHHVYNL